MGTKYRWEIHEHFIFYFSGNWHYRLFSFNLLGKSIAVHTPPKKITTCEILPLGKYIVLALENEPNLVTLELKNCKINQIPNSPVADDDDGNNENTIYGDAEFNGKTFQLWKNHVN